MTTPNPEHGAVEHRLLSDLYTYAPSVFTRLPTVSPLTDETAFSAWAIHLGELWSPTRQCAAPSDYDEKYYNRPAEQFQFLDALHRLEAKIWFEVAKDESGKGLFNTSSWEKAMATAGHTKEGASLLVSSGVWKLQNWLAWRELPPFEQFFAALTRVQLDDVENCIWKSDQSEVPPLVFVPDCDPSVEAARFQRLFIEFSRELPRSRETELLLLLDKLAPLRALPSEALREGQVHELPTQFPAISWLGVSNYPEGSRKAETFWSDIKQVLCTRATWAARAFDATAVALDIVMAEKLLGKKPKPSFGNFRLPRIRESLFEVDPYKPADSTVTELLDTPALIVVKSQAQELSERIAQMVVGAEASANAKGFTLVGNPDNPVPAAPPQFLDPPTKGTPAGAPPLIWDEFLPHFRRAVRLINQDEFTEVDCEHLTKLGQHLVKELDNSIKKRPTATKLRLTETLRECLNEMPHAETMLSHKLAELETTPALYDAHSPLIREAIAAAEDTIGGLIELLGKYYPETLAGSIRTTNGPLAVSELVLKYLPGFHDLNKKIRFEQAAPATTKPPQPGHQALETPAPTVAAPAGVTATKSQQRQENLLEMLCGGYQPGQLLKVIGSDGLGLYDAFRKEPNDTATSTEWAMLYWGLRYKGLLPDGLRNGKAAELLKITFGAKTSKTRIGDTAPDLSQKPQKGTYLARVVDLLESLPA